jgi:polyisoprenoid-binding protein YceI
MSSTQPPRGTKRPLGPAAVVAAVVLVVLAVAGAAGLSYLFLPRSGPAPVTGPSSAPASTSPSTTPSSGTPTASATGGSPSAAAGDVSGTWAVDPSIGSFSDFSGSFVGYRVQEELAGIGANTAVGRTPSVTGTLTVDGTSVTAASFSAQLDGLASDDNRRDGRVRQSLETGTYPAATFELGSPIELGSVPAEGASIQATANGRLTLHGVTRDVAWPLTAQLNGGVIQVTGSVDVALADYGIPKPSSFLVLSIADTATIEVQLFFTRS